MAIVVRNESWFLAERALGEFAVGLGISKALDKNLPEPGSGA